MIQSCWEQLVLGSSQKIAFIALDALRYIIIDG